MSTQIRDYTPQAARDYARAIDAVRAKITRTFTSLQEPQTPMALASEQSRRTKLQDHVHHFIENEWDYNKCADNAAPLKPLNDTQKRELKATAENIMMKFMDGFLLNARVRDIYSGDITTSGIDELADERHINAHADGKVLPARTMYRREAATLDLVDILANHVTNESLSRLKSFGLTDTQSYKACGFLILESMHIFRDELNIPSGGVRPVRGAGVSDEDNVNNVIGYWKRKQRQLEALHFSDSLQAAYRS